MKFSVLLGTKKIPREDIFDLIDQWSMKISKSRKVPGDLHKRESSRFVAWGDAKQSLD